MIVYFKIENQEYEKLSILLRKYDFKYKTVKGIVSEEKCRKAPMGEGVILYRFGGKGLYILLNLKEKLAITKFYDEIPIDSFIMQTQRGLELCIKNLSRN